MAKKPAVKKVEVTLEQLQAVAEDFNTFMFDEGKGIKFEDMDYDDLLAEITEASEDIVADDFVSQDTADTLKDLGIKCDAGISDESADEPEADNDAPESDVDPEPEVDNSAIIEAADAALPKVKKAKKLEDLRAIGKENNLVIPPPFLKDIVKMREYLTKKLTAIAAGEVPKKKGKSAGPKTSKAPKTPRAESIAYTRSHALIDSLKKKSGTREELVKIADDLFVKGGGKTNENVASYMFGYVTPSLIILGLLSKTDGIFSWEK